MDNKKSATAAAATPAELVDEYMKGTPDTLPGCPSAGTYTIGDLQTRPTCSVIDNGDGSAPPNDYNDHILP